MVPTYRRALIVGAGLGLSAALARLLAAEGLSVALAARNTEKLQDLAAETGAALHVCDATDAGAVEALFARLEPALGGSPDVVIYNASARLRGSIADLDPEAVARALSVTALGGFHVAQAAARRMRPQRHGAILFTGASASVKGFSESAPFAMGKFALRGLAQSLSRELQPNGIHVAHVVVDGAIRSAARPDPEDRPDATLDPAAIAKTYLALLRQDRSAWSDEVAVRPWVERF
ncbi:NAD(P)-dependent dehydrogenase (short-subunit alcohol dehydrogenase family) [Methylorubrum rhodinum]|uniref:NAD(P)-dependent dehydrogenase (Short-subunit alcohol dehydrogenase family) n=1 Tax=Methylorubrum rhodinum TaxID=29428 RepID=A0A840ZGU6_9HYPH|nr:SDR family NAD(P)-dependent oxidoreductase [Methylorubrum rhodinum]MBB5756207.1 NAD(P)-dependent dehydrogenase (short-subunit alcohol dehydrogenase family) [Methylorubrum rhodinum]